MHTLPSRFNWRKSTKNTFLYTELLSQNLVILPINKI